MSLIDGMISECSSETSRLAGELLELQGRWSETEAMLTAVKYSHSVKVSKLEVAIGELERDLGKAASSLLKEKKARKAKSSEVRRLQRQIEGDARLASRGIREAKDALRSEFQARLVKISAVLGSLECIRNRDLALAMIEGEMAVVQSFQNETPPTLKAEEARLSGCKGDLAVVDGDFDLILADLKSAFFLLTCSGGPEGKDQVLGESGGDAAPGLDEATALRAPSVVPVAQPKGRKRKFTKGGDGESSQQGDSSIASGLRGKFMSLIDGMISECGSETSRLADSHSVEVSKLEVAIGELERDLGKTASSLLKEKRARKAKYSEVRRLQRQIEGDAGLASRGIREAKDALRSDFQARLSKISAFLGSLECIRNRDLALATIEGGMAVVQSFQSETPPALEAEEARLSGCKRDLAVVDGDFDLILADLKSACFLPMCSEGPEGKDPVLGEGGGDAAPGLNEVTGEEGA
ncbi:hypothetical protein F2Q70_00026098 [Brassica cretica]|uniref:Uncharacterized protein n=1 Tax=Brassica cretica TaxID=69181 RepID=A0A8S9LGG2_BRACR|nr:hypothetical protein F2Q70_00026098 [Brassica cretica]